MRHKNIHRISIIVLVTILIISLVPLFLFNPFKPIEFNQFVLQKLEMSYNTNHPVFVDHIHSRYSAGLQKISNPPIKNQPNYNDSEAMFEYIFSNIPPYAIVYPTEGFYYFSVNHNEQGYIAGNIRLGDINQNKINIAYFKVATNDNESNSDAAYFLAQKENGLLVKKIGTDKYKVTYKTWTKTFKVPFEASKTPTKKLTLTPDEKFIGRIYDESGIRLFLIFNNKTNRFYDILDEDTEIAETFQHIEKNILFGKRTAFVFYNDQEYNRKILIGVDVENIRKNNYLDGPGDQVPITISFKEELIKAYPNTMLGDGTDEHGVYLNKSEWMRVAVSPYERYATIEPIQKRVEQCEAVKEDRSVFWTCLTEEWWNNPVWREQIIQKLKSEGKTYPYTEPTQTN